MIGVKSKKGPGEAQAKRLLLAAHQPAGRDRSRPAGRVELSTTSTGSTATALIRGDLDRKLAVLPANLLLKVAQYYAASDYVQRRRRRGWFRMAWIPADVTSSQHKSSGVRGLSGRGDGLGGLDGWPTVAHAAWPATTIK